MDSIKTEPLPKPGGEKAGRGRAIFWACAAALILACAVWWLTREEAEREKLREETADFINDAVKDTPLAGIGDIARNSPPPLPERVLNPPTEEGTLSGRVVEGTVGSPVDLSANSEPAATGGAPQLSLDPEGPGLAHAGAAAPPQFSNELLPPAEEDSRLPPDYLMDLSQWLVSRYKPGPRGGALGVSAQSLNTLMGVTIAQRTRGGRSSLLRYAMQPSMIQGLYRLYINRFMDDLDIAAQKRGLSREQSDQFHLALGGRALTMAAALDGTLDVPDLAERINKIEALAQDAVDLNANLADAIFQLDELRSAKASKQQIGAAQMRADGITARYRRAMDEHQNARRGLIEAIRRHSGQTLDDDGLIFMAYWVQRRIDDDPDAAESLRGCANVMRDLARRCARVGDSSQRHVDPE